MSSNVLYDVGYPISATLIWAAFAYKLNDLRRDWRDAALWAICVSFACAGVAFTAATPWVYRRVDELLDVPNLATLIIYSNVLMLSVSAQVLLLVWIGPPQKVRARAGSRLVLFGFALAVMIALFVRAPLEVEEPYDFDARYATTPYVAQFLGIYLTAFAVGYGGIARLCWRYAAVAGRPWLGRGLRLTAIGAAFGVGYCVCKAIYLLGRLAGEDLAVWNRAGPVSAVLGVPFLVTGLTIPAWGPRLSELSLWIARYRAYRQLYPLWHALAEVIPVIALEAPTGVWRDRLRLRRLDVRLPRRVLEIDEAWFPLQGYIDPEVVAAAERLGREAGLAGEDLQAVVKAASLAAAVRAKAQGRPPSNAPALPTPPGDADPQTESTDPQGELTRLIRVGRAFTDSPLVAAVLRKPHHGQQDATIGMPTAGNRLRTPAVDYSRQATDSEAMNRYHNLHRIQQLDPEQDCHEIYRTMTLVEFCGVWDALMGLQLAFYSTYGIPAIAERLDQAGEVIARPRKRALDTALLMLELVDHGFSHPQGQKVVQRLRRIHGRYEIDNPEYLYVLGALTIVPTRWLERYGWRKPSRHEREATYWFYRELGQQLGIQHIPPTYQAFERWFDAYEDEHLRLTAASRRLMQASKGLLVGRFPRPLAPVAGALADALLHERLQGAVGISAPPWPTRAALHLALRMRARLRGLRLLPARREPVEAQGHKYGIPFHKVYPRGYTVDDLGPADHADSGGMCVQ